MRNVRSRHLLRSLCVISALMGALFGGASISCAQPESSQQSLGPYGDKVLDFFATSAPDNHHVAGNPLAASRDSEETAPHMSPPQQLPTTELRVPPMAGFQQVANSQDVKDMLKRLVASDVSVMYQTMMMVENGAATGFMNSMHTVGSLLSNTVQATQLQMDLFDAVDATGNKKYEFVNSAYRSAVKENPNFWPGALWWASGDKVKGTPAPVQQIKDNPNTTGANPEDTGGTPPPAAQQGTEHKVLLSKRIFTNANGGSSSSTPENIRPELEQGMKDWVGDAEIVEISQGDVATQTKHNILPAEKVKSAPSTGGTKETRVYELLRKEVKTRVWKHFNMVMKQYCEFKQTTNNYSKDIFQKDRPSKAIQDADWKKISSVDIRPSINLIDQLFKLFVGRRSIQEVKCGESFTGDPNSMPESGQATSSTDTSFDSCKNNPKTCIRNVVMYRVVEFISESQVNYFYRWLWEGVFSQTQKNPADTEILAELFCTNLQFGWPCEPSHEIDLRLEDNRVNWVEFSNKLSKFAQGQGGSAIFRPTTDHGVAGSVGAVGGEANTP